MLGLLCSQFSILKPVDVLVVLLMTLNTLKMKKNSVDLSLSLTVNCRYVLEIRISVCSTSTDF